MCFKTNKERFQVGTQEGKLCAVNRSSLPNTAHQDSEILWTNSLDVIIQGTIYKEG